MLKLIDAHAHLNFPQYDNDREAVFARAAEAGIGIINVGTDTQTSKFAVELAQNRDDVWATGGLHPTESPGDALEQLQGVALLVQDKKVVAIGECGLDYFRFDRAVAEKQKAIFIQQISLANEINKPLMLHIRGAQAYQDTYNILKSETEVRGNAHFFAGAWEEAKSFLDLGFTLSFGGVITFTRDYDEVIKNTPLEMILAETDCPFVAPIPYRGQRNEPSYLPEVVRKLAEIKGVSESEVREATLANAQRVFSFARP